MSFSAFVLSSSVKALWLDYFMARLLRSAKTKVCLESSNSQRTKLRVQINLNHWGSWALRGSSEAAQGISTLQNLQVIILLCCPCNRRLIKSQPPPGVAEALHSSTQSRCHLDGRHKPGVVRLTELVFCLRGLVLHRTVFSPHPLPPEPPLSAVAGFCFLDLSQVQGVVCLQTSIFAATFCMQMSSFVEGKKTNKQEIKDRTGSSMAVLLQCMICLQCKSIRCTCTPCCESWSAIKKKKQLTKNISHCR